MPKLQITSVSSPLRQSFAISRGSKSVAETVRVTLTQDNHEGRGECVPYGRYGESVGGVMADIAGLEAEIEAGLTREALQTRLPAGAARCALDTAFWDLEAKQSGHPVWKLAGLPPPQPLPCTMSLSLGTPEQMAEAARQTAAGLLKLKLGGPDDLDRIIAVHEARPEARLIVDGNEGLIPSSFALLVEAAAKNGVVMIEQPFPVGQDTALAHTACPIAICADESVHTSRDIQGLARLYDMVNIKLDKAGGLTEALAMLKAARQCHLGVMVGCMVAGSLSMAPALILGAAADLIDLDGPLWLADDIAHGLTYQAGNVSPPSRDLWG